MKHRAALWIAALAAAFVIGLAAGLPARLALGFVPPELRARLTAVEGTVWRGSAKLMLDGGTVADLDWTLAPTSPLLLAPRLTLTAVHPLGEYRGELVLRRAGYELTDGRLQTTLGPLARFAGLPAGALLGQVEVRAIAATLDDDGVLALGCEGEVVGVTAAGAGSTLALGDLAIACSADAGGPLVTLQDRGGPLALEARVTLAPGWRYLVVGTAGTRAGAAPDLVEILPLLGEAEGPDRVRFRYAGSLAR